VLKKTEEKSVKNFTVNMKSFSQKGKSFSYFNLKALEFSVDIEDQKMIFYDLRRDGAKNIWHVVY